MVALILTFSLLLASSAFAATKASSQILKHSIDITANKGGEIAIEVSVTGNGLMKQIWKHMEHGLNSLTKNISFQMMIQNGWKMYWIVPSLCMKEIRIIQVF